MNLYPVWVFLEKKRDSPQKKAGIRFDIFQKMEVFMSDGLKLLHGFSHSGHGPTPPL